MTGERRIVAPGDHAHAAAQAILAGLLQAQDRVPEPALVLAGGATPFAAFGRLALALREKPALRDRLRIFFGDERGVPPDHEESNYARARLAFLDPAGIDPGRVFRMEAERADREVAALNYERRFPDPVDLLLLGIGEDGHCASLFPGAAVLGEARRRVLPAESPSGVRARLTITPPVIAGARACIVLASGRAKAPAVARALRPETRARDCPAALAREGLWILDSEAAAALPRGPGTAAS